MKLTNLEILNIFDKINESFKDNNEYIPIKIGFAIQKNISTLYFLVREIENAKVKIAEQYGQLENEKTGEYKISEDKIEDAQKEFNDLLNFEQEIDIRTIKLSDIENLSFTLQQINSLLFMIKDNE